jgi:hypothetical protein
MQDQHVTIGGKRWALQFVPLRDLGECDNPKSIHKRIRIKRSLKGRERLDTLIHEMAHAADWPKSEEWVESFATDVARVLWKLGYRAEDDA